MLASAIQEQFRERVHRVDRSVKQAGFLVLRQIAMPGVLVEAGFLSHPGERNFLKSETGRDYLASAIFRAFRDYKKKIEAKSNFRLITVQEENEKLTPAVKATAVKNASIYFSVQIVSLSQPVDVTPVNFKGEESVFMQNSNNIYRYFSGKFNSAEEAREEQKRLRKKFTGAFVVAFENDVLISFEQAMEKM
jgi:N-acetylmuramoyl-L-alanine amidase